VKATLVTKAIQTAAIKIQVAIPPEKPTIQGFITGHAIIRTRPEQQALLEKVDAGEFETEEEVLREMYSGFDGLGNEANGDQALTGEDAWNELLTGPLSGYLPTAAIQAYYGQYGDARRKNSKRLR
jgi:hypothetical protein